MPPEADGSLISLPLASSAVTVVPLMEGQPWLVGLGVVVEVVGVAVVSVLASVVACGGTVVVVSDPTGPAASLPAVGLLRICLDLDHWHKHRSRSPG